MVSDGLRPFNGALRHPAVMHKQKSLPSYVGGFPLSFLSTAAVAAIAQRYPGKADHCSVVRLPLTVVRVRTLDATVRSCGGLRCSSLLTNFFVRVVGLSSRRELYVLQGERARSVSLEEESLFINAQLQNGSHFKSLALTGGQKAFAIPSSPRRLHRTMFQVRCGRQAEPPYHTITNTPTPCTRPPTLLAATTAVQHPIHRPA